MKRILTVLFTITVAIFFTSCATVYPNQKLIIGTWKTVKAEKYDIPGSAGATGKTAATKTPTNKTPESDLALHSTTAPVTDSTVAVKEPSKAEQQLARLIQSESRSTLTVNADKTAVKEYPGKTVHGTWKMKSNTRLQVVSKETDKKMLIDIQSINDSIVVIKEPLPIGGLKVTMKKVK